MYFFLSVAGPHMYAMASGIFFYSPQLMLPVLFHAVALLSNICKPDIT